MEHKIFERDLKFNTRLLLVINDLKVNYSMY